MNGGELYVGVEIDFFRADDLCFYEPIMQFRSRIDRIAMRYAPVGPIPQSHALDWKWCRGVVVMPVMNEDGRAFHR